MREFYYDDRVRFDFGFGNPNQTGALVALAMVAGFALFGSRKTLWIGLVAELVLGLMLIHTFSRGALVAVGLGLIICSNGFRKTLSTAQMRGIASVLLILILYAISVGFARRLGQAASGDKSIENRVSVYKAVPQMLWDAPGGWGRGRAGQAYRQWYQDPGRKERYNSLVSSHATWLVEMPWYWRAAYVGGWASLLIIVSPSALKKAKVGDGWRFVSLAVVATAFVAIGFSSVGGIWQMWVLPLLAVLASLALRLRSRPVFCSREILTLSFALVLALLFFAFPFFANPGSITLKDGVVTLELEKREYGRRLFIAEPDAAVLGEFYGHTIRSLQSNLDVTSVQVQWTGGPVPRPVRHSIAIFAGTTSNRLVEIADYLNDLDALVLINPTDPDHGTLEVVQHADKARLVFGGQYGALGRQKWVLLTDGLPNVELKSVAGASQYVESWPEFVVWQ